MTNLKVILMPNRISIGHTHLSIYFTFEEALEIRKFLNDNHKKLKPEKDWNNCPFEDHHNDCKCDGMGGDR